MPRSSSVSRFLAGRLLWGGGVMWVTLTAAFAILWLLPEYRVVGLARVETGLAALGLKEGGFVDGYLAWMETFLTLDWGQSIYYGRPVADIYADRLPITLAYVIPGVAVSVLVGTLLTTYAATDRGGYLNRLLSALSTLGLGLPAFFIAQAFFFAYPVELGWTHVYDPDLSLWHTQNLLRLQIPAAIVALGLIGVQVRHVQTETGEHLGMEYVKTARAKGVGRLGLARHVFRNAWPSMVSLVQSEALGLMLLSVIVVERILDVPGVGAAIFNGFVTGDPLLSFVAVFGMVLVGIVTTLARDLTRYMVDPQFEK